MLRRHLSKLEEALQYASLTLTSQGIVVSKVELRSVIEKAYLEYKAKTNAVLTTESLTSEGATQAAAKEAVSDLAAKLNNFLAQATADVSSASPTEDSLSRLYL
ncbi:hypothetical protein [Paenibacillus terrae]|uniref:hypothetical protein n=1 Tax=Paenibacillus terrae TaxID=159743 RepID=UPI00207B1458|nr:hypothetical protein [Paenibacillus terrae]